jgi:hypothetical protein
MGTATATKVATYAHTMGGSAGGTVEYAAMTRLVAVSIIDAIAMAAYKAQTQLRTQLPLLPAADRQCGRSWEVWELSLATDTTKSHR